MEINNKCFTTFNGRVFARFGEIGRLCKKKKAEVRRVLEQFKEDVSTQYYQSEIRFYQDEYFLSQDAVEEITLYWDAETVGTSKIRENLVDQMRFLQSICVCETSEQTDRIMQKSLRWLIDEIAQTQDRPGAFVWLDFDKAFFKVTDIDLKAEIAVVHESRPGYLAKINRLDEAVHVAYDMLKAAKRCG